MALVRSRRVCHARMGRLVQPSPAAGAHRQHSPGRSRRPLLRYARTASHGSVTQTKQPPTNPGRLSTEGQVGPITDQTAESYAATFDTNVLGVILSMKHEVR